MTEGLVPEGVAPADVSPRRVVPEGVVPHDRSRNGTDPQAAASTNTDESTGDDAIDQALVGLIGLDALPLRAHVGVFDAVHGALQDRLADAEA